MRDSLESQFWDGISPDREAAQKHLIYQVMAGLLEKEEETVVIENDEIRIPRWQVTISPRVEEVREQFVMLNYFLTSPLWGQRVFECAVGMGDTPLTAMGMAAGSFLFAMMDGVRAMETDCNPVPFCTQFAGREHRWSMYKSNIVGMGETPVQESCPDYWQELQDQIGKRLGNQRMCYIKIYGAKNGEDITGECRINDVKSEELSAMVAEIVGRWKTENFGSQKQFFFLRQEEETTEPYPFTEEEIAEHTGTAVRMFHESHSGGNYETFPQRLAQAIGDGSLAQELYSFLPEICAENAFHQIRFPETLILTTGGQDAEVYKTQLASYYPMHRALFEGFHTGAFSDWTDEVYREYIGVSAIYSVICKAKEEGADLTEPGGEISLTFNTRDDYQLR